MKDPAHPEPLREREYDGHEEDVHLTDYLRILQRRKYVIALTFLLVMPVAFIQAFSGAPMYSAAARLLVEKEAGPALLSNDNVIYVPGFLATQTQIIKSKKVGRRVAERLNLHETYAQYFPAGDAEPSWPDKVVAWFRGLYAAALKLAGLAPAPAPRMQSDAPPLTEAEKKEQTLESMAWMISNGLSVEMDRDGGNVLSVSYTSASPELAANIVNAVAAAYKASVMDMRAASTAESLEWLKEKADAQREKLQASEQKLQEYKKAHGIYTVGDQEATFPGKIASLSGRLTQVQAEVEEMASLYNEIRRKSVDEALNLPVVAENATVAALRKDMIAQEQAINSLSKTLGEKHPRMIRAREDLQSLREKLNAEVRAAIRTVKTKYELARERAEKIQALLDETKQNAAAMNDRLIRHEILKRDVEINKLLYDRLLARIKEYDATEARQPVEVWMVDDAATPRYPTNKRPKRTILLGALLSLMLGAGLAFFLEYLDNTVKTAEDAEARLGLPILGMIPLLRGGAHPVEKVVLAAPQSVISEQYKSLRTAVLLSSARGAVRSILVTGMNQMTGKTVTAVNLAASFAQSERRTLLMDADMRRAAVHGVFGLNNDAGLSSYLAGQSDKVVHEIEDAPILHVMPAGPKPPNPSELLSSSRLESLLRELSDAYDCIVVDSAPMLDVTDALLISKATDQTLLVARSGVSTYASLRRGEKMLAAIDVRIIGCLINAVDRKRERQYYGRYYGGYYSDRK